MARPSRLTRVPNTKPSSQGPSRRGKSLLRRLNLDRHLFYFSNKDTYSDTRKELFQMVMNEKSPGQPTSSLTETRPAERQACLGQLHVQISEVFSFMWGTCILIAPSITLTQPLEQATTSFGGHKAR